MKASLLLRNRQRVCQIDLRYFRRIVGFFLREHLGALPYELGIYLVDSPFITELNQTYLQHQGATDVISFDYRDPGQADRLWGEVFIALREAVSQSGQFHTTWQSELVRYLVHGVLHLSGYDDKHVGPRRRMKAAEDRWVRRLGALFDFELLGSGRARKKLSPGKRERHSGTRERVRTRSCLNKRDSHRRVPQ